MIKFSWKSSLVKDEKVKFFLKRRGVSHRMFSIMKKFGGKIVINDQEVFTNDFIKPEQKITIFMPDEKGNPDLVPDFNDDLKILYEDNNFLIVNKPPFLTTIPGPSDRKTTLINIVKAHLVKEDAPSKIPRVVTRLDRNTSGIVLFAKHKFAHTLLNRALMERRDIKKYYIALVSGNIKKNHGLINQPITRIEGDYIRRKVGEGGKESITEYWVQKRYQNFTEIKIQIHTGRTHQIRVHFAWLKHPLIGDELYGGFSSPYISRQALHASEIIFLDPFINKIRHFKAKLPDDILETLKSASLKKSNF